MSARAVLDPGDECIIPAPYWVSYPDMALLADGVPVFIRGPVAGLQDHAGAARSGHHAAQQNDVPQQPEQSDRRRVHEGRTAGARRGAREASANRDRVRRDVRAHLLGGGTVHELRRGEPGLYDRTVTINGCSKAYAMTGWRIGYCGGPKELANAMATIQGQSTSNASSISQRAATVALNGDQSCVAEMNKAFKERHDFVVAGLNAIPGISCRPGAGTFYAFADVSGAMQASAQRRQRVRRISARRRRCRGGPGFRVRGARPYANLVRVQPQDARGCAGTHPPRRDNTRSQSALEASSEAPRPMNYRNLGSTGLKVSEICLGCMTFGVPERGDHPWTIGEAASRPVIRRAVELGINFFDTADVYSDGTSEEIVGGALKDFMRREDAVIATKVYFPMSAAPNDRGLSRKTILTAIDKSLRRLGTDYVDLYQIHRWDYTTPIEETLQALARHRARRQSALYRRVLDVRLAVLQGAATSPSNRVGRNSSRCRTITTCSTARKSAR
jgi:hypothetical protein